jgi:hypothetical protein
MGEVILDELGKIARQRWRLVAERAIAGCQAPERAIHKDALATMMRVLVPYGTTEGQILREFVASKDYSCLKPPVSEAVAVARGARLEPRRPLQRPSTARRQMRSH